MAFADHADEPSDDEDFDKFYRMALETVIRQNTDYVFSHSESPIETIFLNSLILGFIKCDSLGLIIHPTFKDTENEIMEFRKTYSNFQKFIAWCDERFSSFTEIESYLDDELKAGKMEKEEREHFRQLLFRYYLLPLHDSYHMTLQPKFPNIKIDGKSIRPDIFFWIPTKPEIKVIVECDGFDYHSDKNKFASDRKRDRALQSRGYQVLRYSGTEIYNNPAGVTADLAQHLWSLVEEENEKLH